MNILAEYQRHYSYLFSLAYRMLGSVVESEDILQDTYLKWQRAMPRPVDHPRAYLATIVTRLCLDRLRQLRAERKEYPGPWLPEPLAGLHQEIPEKRTSLTTAFLLLLERLTPAERAVYVLRQVFEHEYDDIALILGKTQPSCRQLFHRARKHLATGDKLPDQEEGKVRALLEQFLQFTKEGNYPALRELLVKEVRLVADGGGKVRGAVRHILNGADPVARFVIGAARKLGPTDGHVEFRTVNGTPAAVGTSSNGIYMVITIQCIEGRITDVFITANPDKLKHLNS